MKNSAINAKDTFATVFAPRKHKNKSVYSVIDTNGTNATSYLLVSP